MVSVGGMVRYGTVWYSMVWKLQHEKEKLEWAAKVLRAVGWE